MKKNSLLSSATWNIFSLMVVAVAGFVTMPIVIRGIGADGVGGSNTSVCFPVSFQK